MSSRGPATLDDLASLVVQLEPNDAEGIATLRATLREVVASAEFSAAVRAIAVEALFLFDDPRFTPADSERFLEGLRAMVERALAAHEDGSSETPAAVQPTAASTAPLALGSDPTMLAEFVSESREYLDDCEAALLRLESNAGDMEAVNTIFRAFHTIKGTSVFLAVDASTELAHEAETLLSLVRDGSLACTSDVADLIFRAIDTLKDIMRGVEQGLAGDTPRMPSGYSAILDALRARAGAMQPQAQPELDATATPSSPPPPVPPVPPVPQQERRGRSDAESRPPAKVRVRTDRLHLPIEMVGEPSSRSPSCRATRRWSAIRRT